MHVCSHCGSLLAGRDLSISPTPVPTLIGTTTVPSLSEESAIRRWLVDMDSALSRLDGETDRVQAVLDALRRKHQVLSYARKQHTALLSPIRRLPVELLSETFILSLPDDWKDKIYDFRRAVNLPTSVCRYWRNVALSTPRMWNSIGFRLEDRTAQADVDLARTWIVRSRSVASFHLPLVLWQRHSTCSLTSCRRCGHWICPALGTRQLWNNIRYAESTSPSTKPSTLPTHPSRWTFIRDLLRFGLTHRLFRGRPSVDQSHYGLHVSSATSLCLGFSWLPSTWPLALPLTSATRYWVLRQILWNVFCKWLVSIQILPVL